MTPRAATTADVALWFAGLPVASLLTVVFLALAAGLLVARTVVDAPRTVRRLP
jgi:hypothetical protein